MEKNRLAQLLVGLLACVLVLLLSACEQPRDPKQDTVEIRKVLANRAKAIATKDLELYRSLFMPEYTDGQTTLNLIITDMKEAFERHPGSIKFTAQRAPVEFNLNTARVIQRISYEVEGMEKPIETREIVLLRLVGEQWLISGGVQIGLI
ncbi:MAG: nuclear transport factor 2 family protein [Gammaproteobacteria bacterium]|nr:nuclear transport factor 2 family protein [Gammaproteobacteria bacterium]MDH5693430.1 nuclear transport factor 2 family protein [Gammaproteobacteria bacterium]